MQMMTIRAHAERGFIGAAALAVVALSAGPGAQAQGAKAQDQTRAPSAGSAANAKPVATASAVFSGKLSGTISLTDAGAGVLLRGQVAGLPAGKPLAFHVHEHGVCDMAHGNMTAGGHFNPSGAPHGYLASGGPHAGDMPNQTVGPDGVMRVEAFSDRISLRKGVKNIIGRTLMIHARPDDYASQPAGDAGDRIGCAVITAGGADK